MLFVIVVAFFGYNYNVIEHFCFTLFCKNIFLTVLHRSANPDHLSKYTLHCYEENIWNTLHKTADNLLNKYEVQFGKSLFQWFKTENIFYVGQNWNQNPKLDPLT